MLELAVLLKSTLLESVLCELMVLESGFAGVGVALSSWLHCANLIAASKAVNFMLSTMISCITRKKTNIFHRSCSGNGISDLTIKRYLF